METTVLKKVDWYFFILCLVAGVVAEWAFFHSQIGISYIVFIVLFYALVFWRLRNFPFSHQRIGYLLLICIWLLAATYYFYDVTAFYALNILVIPVLVIIHLALITAPKQQSWAQLPFIGYCLQQVARGIAYSARFTVFLAKLSKRQSSNTENKVWRKVLLGVAIAVPFLFIIIGLLMSADLEFARMVGKLPTLLTFRVDYVIRLLIVLIYGFGFFGYLQVIRSRRIVDKPLAGTPAYALDGIVTLTFLTFINLVYALFVLVQFTYFFSGGTLESGLTYADYARRGFIELLAVTLINLTVTVAVIFGSKKMVGTMKVAIQMMVSLLVVASGILLVSSFMRMGMYEEAYGFTFLRVLVHSFMIFLMVILMYTLLRIWFEKLSLVHFYVVAALLYYTGVNVVGLDRMVVELNVERFEETGKIDIYYLYSLSATGGLALLELYEKNPKLDGLAQLLQEQKAGLAYVQEDHWQETNRLRDQWREKLANWEPKR